MKKKLRLALCAGLAAALLSVPALAAGTEEPQQQGDFSVLVNGEYVTFTDAAPQIRDNRSCLPFVAVFDQLGFAEEDMTWDAATKTVTAMKGSEGVRLTIGEPSITVFTLVEEGGVQAEAGTTMHTDVAPYVSNNRTYIPFGLVADALGYHVGWDSFTKTVIIDDVDAILAANTETYELMDKYMAYGRAFAEENQKVTGGYTMDLAFAATQAPAEPGQEVQDMDLHFAADGDYEMITAGSTAFQFDTQLGMDLSVAVNGVDATELMESTGDLPALPESIGFQMRGDMETGALYFNLDSPELAQLTGWSADNWYKLDLKALFDQTAALTGMDYAQLMQLSTASLDMSFEDLLATMLRQMPLTSAQFTTSDTLELYNAIFGDSRFVKSGSNYVNTFLDEDGVTGTFTLYMRGDKVNGYGMKMEAADPSFGSMELLAEMKGSDMAMTMGFSSSDALAGMDFSLTMSMDGTYKATTEQPETEPPVGASWIDLFGDEAGGSAGGSVSEFGF